MRQLRGRLAGEGSSVVHGPAAAASSRRRAAAAAAGLLIVLCVAAIAALAERESPSGQLGQVGARSGSRAPLATFSPSAKLAPAEATSSARLADATQPSLPAAARRRAAEVYAKLPLAFIPNAGQTDERVRYYAQAPGYGLYFTDRKAVLALQGGDRGEALDLRFLGARPEPELVAADRAPGRVNYLTGSERHTDLPTYGRLIYHDLWPGIDMVFRGRGGRLDYEFRLRPGAKPADIRLAYAGAEGLSRGGGGGLLIETPLGNLRDAPPESFQRIDGHRIPVESRYALSGDSYGFRLGAHRRDEAVVIDPSLTYSTYLGGSDFEHGLDIAVDSEGSAYIAGITSSHDFPTTPGAFDRTQQDSGWYGNDGFVTKFNPAGSHLVYSTYLGGGSDEGVWDIAVDQAGFAYVTGNTHSADFPTTAGAFDTSFNGGEFGDAYAAKLNPAGSGLSYSTYLGGRNDDEAGGIAVDTAGFAYVVGDTSSPDFPTTAGAFDTSFNGGEDAQDTFVTKLNPAGSSLAYSTYLGEKSLGSDIALDSAGAAYVAGSTASPDFPTTAGAFDTSFNGGEFGDAYAAKLNPAGSGLSYSTYLGGSNGDNGFAVALDAAGAAYVTGQTASTDLPTTEGAFDASYNGGEDDGFGGDQDAFVTKLDPLGTTLAYSTYLGGSSRDVGFAIALDSAGAAYLTGTTSSPDYPASASALDATLDGHDDAFVTKLDAAGTGLSYSTYLGGSDSDYGLGIALDSAGAAYLTGGTESGNFPATVGAFDTSLNGWTDAFVTKLTVGTPSSTPRCKVTSGGRITAENGDRATLGGSTRSDAAGRVRGRERYRDHGPALPQSVRSIRILALTCNPAGTAATISGEATIDGSGSRTFTIDIRDLGEPGRSVDTYRILLDTGYDSGAQALEGGNLQIHKP